MNLRFTIADCRLFGADAAGANAVRRIASGFAPRTVDCGLWTIFLVSMFCRLPFGFSQSVLTADGLAAFGSSAIAGGGGGGGAWTMVFHSIAGGTANGATNTVDSTGATGLTVAVGSFSSKPTPADNFGNTYVLDISTNISSYFVSIYHCIPSTVGAGHKIWAAGTSTYDTVSVIGWTGMNTSPQDLSKANAVGAFDFVTPPAFTPSQNNSLLIGAAVVDKNHPDNVAASSVFGLLDHVNCGGGGLLHLTVFTNIQTTAASVSVTFTNVGAGTPNPHLGAISSFKPSP
jgi:hypothetical protein